MFTDWRTTVESDVETFRYHLLDALHNVGML